MVTTRYDKRGVSSDKGDVHAATAILEKGLYPKAFCKILPDIVGGDTEFCNIMHADTAGTKSALAYLYWRETGDLSVWPGVVQDALVMNLDDLICVGCTQGIVVSSTIARNKHLITAEVLQAIIRGTVDFTDLMKEYGIDLHLAGGETADVGDLVRTIDIGYTMFARMKRSDLVINNIQAGDVVIGLSSFGQAIYEDYYNGGMGSNGLTSARHDVLAKYYYRNFPESFDPNTDKSLIYSGKKRLTDRLMVDGFYTSVGKLLLSPTRTYAPILSNVFENHRQHIHGLIHCSGGGQTKVLRFLENKRVVKDNLFKIPRLFELIQKQSKTEWEEMFRVFNMGHRLEIYLPAKYAQQIIDIAAQFQVCAQVIGHVEDAEGASVFIKSPHGEFEYK